jgi:hypothetical protein
VLQVSIPVFSRESWELTDCRDNQAESVLLVTEDQLELKEDREPLDNR